MKVYHNHRFVRLGGAYEDLESFMCLNCHSKWNAESSFSIDNGNRFCSYCGVQWKEEFSKRKTRYYLKSKDIRAGQSWRDGLLLKSDTPHIVLIGRIFLTKKLAYDSFSVVPCGEWSKWQLLSHTGLCGAWGASKSMIDAFNKHKNNNTYTELRLIYFDKNCIKIIKELTNDLCAM